MGQRQSTESYNGNPGGPWRNVGSATLADISKLGKVNLPLQEAVIADRTRGIKQLWYRYRLVVGPGQYMYLTGTDKAYNGMGKYLLGNQVIPPGYGGLYVLHLNKEGIPSGFRLPGYRNLGRVAPIMVNGAVGPYKYLLQGRKQLLNPDRYEYRVVIPGGPVPEYVPLLTHSKLRNGDTVKPVPHVYTYNDTGPFSVNASYRPGLGYQQPPAVGYKVMLKDY